MKVSTERILTTHTGSLPRPGELVDMLLVREAGQDIDQRRFDSVVQQAVADVVQKQAAIGLDIVSDGEMSKVSYATYVADRLTGFESHTEVSRSLPADLDDFPEFAETHRKRVGARRFLCTGPVRYVGHTALQADINNLRSALDSANVTDAFVTAASPGVIARFLPNRYYATSEAYLWALADAMREEYQTILEAGFLLQLDCPDLTNSNGPGTKPADMDLRIEALNRATSGLQEDRLRLHLCWGNAERPHRLDVPLSEIIDDALAAHVAGVSFEGANPRHEHEWNVWKSRRLPAGKVIIPGVIDSTTNFIEHPELVAQRVARYVELVGRDSVIAGTDCGFGGFAGSATVDGRIAFAKLDALVEGARLATRELY
jgi:5-methyltetrahydropteroyltriglutamate--homocysteine methyltransferase